MRRAHRSSRRRASRTAGQGDDRPGTPPPAPTGSEADAEPQQPDEDDTGLARWWNRTTKAILLAGALASAIAAIVSLLPSSSHDPEDSAEITVVRVFPDVALSEYQQRVEQAAPVSPDDDGAAPDGARGDAPAAVRLVASGAVSTTATVTSTTTTSTSAPTSTSSTASSSTTGPSAVVPGTIARPAPRPSGFVVPPAAIAPSYVAALEVARELGCGDDDQDCTETSFPIVIPHSVDPEGNPVPPEEAAAQVVELLQHTRRVEGHDEPVGVMVETGVKLVGLRGRAVLLTWSMWRDDGGARLYGDWLNENLAYRLEPTTDSDTTSVPLWIPLPPEPGPYVVRVELDLEESSLALASGYSEPFR